jgi:hypothetical protein
MQRVVIFGLLFCCWGCGRGDGLERAAVTGKVTLDGVPIANGNIAFRPSGNTKGPAVGGPIQDGQYAIAVAKGPVVGTNCVEIHSWKKTGRKVQDPGMGMVDEKVDLPERYNTQSTLTAEIQPGTNTLDYALTSK